MTKLGWMFMGLVLVGCEAVEVGDGIGECVDGELCERHVEGSLEIACPIGVTCDADFDYRAYRFDSREVYVRLSFEPTIVGDLRLQTLRDSFNYATLEIRFPDRDISTEDREVTHYYSPLEPVREVTFDSFEDGRLHFSLAGTIDGITREIYDLTDESCITDDILGLCYEREEFAAPFNFEFDLTVPE